MAKGAENNTELTKIQVYKQELAKLHDVFKDVEDNKKKLVEGLIEEAAFLKAENSVLRDSLVETGMVKFHPENRSLQKPVEAARQYLKNVNSYAVVVKTLNGVLSKNIIEPDDELDEFAE